jgi:prohibitin 2
MKNIFFIVFPLFFLSACEQVDTGHRGVKTHFGEVNMKIGSMPEGLYFYNIFTDSITEMDTRTQRKEGKTETYTKDVQQANITYVVNYRLNQEAAHIMLKDVGKNWEAQLLTQAVEGELKKVIGRYDAVDLIEKRGIATNEIKASIIAALAPQNVTIQEFQMVDISYLPEFQKAVEKKVIAIQKASEAVNRTVQIREEAKQTIVRAEAEANSIKIKANALTANATLVQYNAVEKWDGKLPVYMLGGAVPLINIDKIR